MLILFVISIVLYKNDPDFQMNPRILEGCIIYEPLSNPPLFEKNNEKTHTSSNLKPHPTLILNLLHRTFNIYYIMHHVFKFNVPTDSPTMCNCVPTIPNNEKNFRVNYLYYVAIFLADEYYV